MNRGHQIISIFLLFLSCSNQKTNSDVHPITPLNVAVTYPRKDQITKIIEGYGNISFSEKSDVTPFEEGRILTILEKEGSFVEKGQLLVILENHQLSSEYLKAQSALKSAEASLMLSRTNYSDALRRGEARFLSLEKSKLLLTQSEKEIQNLREDLEKKKALLDLDGATREEVDDKEMNLEKFLTEYQVEQIDYQINAIGYRDEDLISQGFRIPNDPIQKKQLLIELNTQNLAAEVQAAEASHEGLLTELQSLKTLVESLEVRSPRRGVVGAIYFDEGELIPLQTKYCTIINIQKVAVTIPVLPEAALLLHQGMNALISIPAIKSMEFPGMVEQIGPTVDPRSGNTMVKIIFDNPGEILPGMFSHCSIDLNSIEEGLFIPLTAMSEIEGSEGIVFIVRNNMALKVKCQLGEQDNNEIRIIEGLCTTDIIILDPPPHLREGQQITAGKHEDE